MAGTEAGGVAADLARAAAGLPDGTEAAELPVRRVDRPGRRYWLVVLGPASAAVAVAAVDLDRGAVLSWAAMPGTRPHVTVDAEEAVRRSGRPPGAPVGLVWAASAATRSPLYPVWEVGGVEPVYVALDGTVSRHLGEARA